MAIGLAWTGDRHVSTEVAQEALSRAFGAWHRVGRLDAPGAWARRVTLNLLIDHRRNQRRQLRLVDRLGPAEPGASPADWLANGPWWRAVRELPDRERAAVTLHYVEDLSIAEVAEILEIASGTVKATLAHARQKLRVALTEGGDQ